MAPAKGRALGGTEQSWCRAVAGGTGTTVVAFLSTKAPDTSLLQNAVHKIQNSHPVLRSTIHSSSSPTSFSFITSPSPSLHIKTFPLSYTSTILNNNVGRHHSPSPSPSPFHVILEHELKNATWTDGRRPSNGNDGYSCEVFFACVYALPDSKWALVLRFHTAACDRTTAEGLLGELVELMAETAKKPAKDKGMGKKGSSSSGEVELAIEDLVPRGKASKALWVRGVDVLGYSVRSLRLTNLKFQDVKSERFSEVVRLQMDRNDTARILTGCRTGE